MGFTGLGAILFAPIGNLLFKKVSVRLINRYNFIVYGVI